MGYQMHMLCCSTSANVGGGVNRAGRQSMSRIGERSVVGIAGNGGIWVSRRGYSVSASSGVQNGGGGRDDEEEGGVCRDGIGRLAASALVTFLAQTLVTSTAVADVEVLNESQRMRLEMLQQIEKQIQKSNVLETPPSPGPAVEAPALIPPTAEEVPPPPLSPAQESSPPSASTIMDTNPSSPVSTEEEPAGSSSPTITEDASSSPSNAIIPPPSSPADVVNAPSSLPRPPLDEAPYIPTQSAAVPEVVEAGSSNVLAVVGVVGATVLGAYFLQQPKQPLPSSSPDVKPIKPKGVEEPAAALENEVVESNNLAENE